MAGGMFTGCGKSGDGPETHPVTGVVTLAGAPVADATVTFAPTAASGQGAQAKTDAEGEFDVQMAIDAGKSPTRGLPAGDYRVTVIKMEMPPGPPSLSNPPKNVLPKKYADPKTSGFHAKVSADGTNHIELPLAP